MRRFSCHLHPHPGAGCPWRGALLLASFLLGLAIPANAGPAAPPAKKPPPPAKSTKPPAPPPPPSLRPSTGGKAPLGSLLRPIAPLKGPPKPLTPLKKGEKPSEAQARLIRQRCEKAGYLVGRATRFGDGSLLTIRYYEQALNLCPGHAVGNFRLAVIRLQQKDRAGAQNLFERVIKWHPRFLDGHFNLGLLYRHAGNPKKAREFFERAVEIDGRDPLSLYNLGVLQLLTEERDAALQNFQRAIREAPGFAEAHFFVGALMHDRGNYRQGKAFLLEALRLKPGFALPRVYLAAILEKEGKAQRAQAELNRALQASPDSIKVGYGFEEFYFREGGGNDFLTAVRKRPEEDDLPVVVKKKLPTLPKAGQKSSSSGEGKFGPRREAKELSIGGSKGKQIPKKGFLYRVKPGDTIAKIAARYGTSVAALLRLNEDRIEHPAFLDTGEMIRLPRARRKLRAKRIQRESRRKRKKTARRGGYRLYRVRRGDTLHKIARRFGTTAQRLLRINRDRIEHPALLSAGVQIRIPVKRSRIHNSQIRNSRTRKKRARQKKPAAKEPS